ncbi:polysaccharide biosynthesis protein, partial [Arthrobacter deserti]|nr:polysaccharide biosynthesis protein [Arthrobacter deserti]
AGGSIGSELCRQIHEFAPSELIMLDRDESGLQATQISITGQGLLSGKDTVLADIRDPQVVSDIFRERRPEVVFHAAALKHVSLLGQYPEEAWKTNVLGSLNVLNAAREVGVQTFVNISTDKAANPTTVLGHSKRVAEKLTAWVARQTGRKYVSVRFGNVLGSRGSVLPL